MWYYFFYVNKVFCLILNNYFVNRETDAKVTSLVNQTCQSKLEDLDRKLNKRIEHDLRKGKSVRDNLFFNIFLIFNYLI